MLRNTCASFISCFLAVQVLVEAASIHHKTRGTLRGQQQQGRDHPLERDNRHDGDSATVWEFEGDDSSVMRFQKDIFRGGTSAAAIEAHRRPDRYGKGYRDVRTGKYRKSSGGLEIRIRKPQALPANHVVAVSEGGFTTNITLPERVLSIQLSFDYQVTWEVTGIEDEGKIVAMIGSTIKDTCGDDFDELPCYNGISHDAHHYIDWQTATFTFNGPMQAGTYPLALGAELFHTASSPPNEAFTLQIDNVRVFVDSAPADPQQHHHQPILRQQQQQRHQHQHHDGSDRSGSIDATDL